MSLYQPSLLWRLIDIAKSLSTEKDPWRLLDRILVESLNITGCDGGTLYLLQQDDDGTWLNYAILLNHTLNISQTNRDSQESAMMPIPVYDRKTGEPNHHNIAAHCALTQTTIKIDDAQQEKRFDVSGIRSFDELFDYRTRSILTVPLLNRTGTTVGVIQLINARSPIGGMVQPFTAQDVNVIQALAALVAITVDSNALVARNDTMPSLPSMPHSPMCWNGSWKKAWNSPAPKGHPLPVLQRTAPAGVRRAAQRAAGSVPGRQQHHAGEPGCPAPAGRWQPQPA